MSHSYVSVQWNRQKKIYDRSLWAGIVAYLAVFLGLGFSDPNFDETTLLIRAFGTAAIILLHLILCIGPLCRLHQGFLPLLYNRRHMGVSMFLLALVHSTLAIIQFHTQGDINPIHSIFLANTEIDSISRFPFETLGFAAFLILFLMAATSHDFWLANLTSPLWKALHMAVYWAYGLLIMHIALGILQQETSPLLAIAVGLGAVLVIGLHLAAAFKETHTDIELAAADADFVDVAAVDEIPDGRAKIVTLAGERVAVFRNNNKFSAISNTCRHQNGPLGEGRIIDGLVTCPWHGYQYRPEDGQSPPPFTEKVCTFAIRCQNGRLQVHPKPNAPGTYVEPAELEDVL